MDSSPEVLAFHDFWKSIRVTAPPDFFTAFRNSRTPKAAAPENVLIASDEKKNQVEDAPAKKTVTGR